MGEWRLAEVGRDKSLSQWPPTCSLASPAPRSPGSSNCSRGIGSHRNPDNIRLLSLRPWPDGYETLRVPPIVSPAQTRITKPPNSSRKRMSVWGHSIRHEGRGEFSRAQAIGQDLVDELLNGHLDEGYIVSLSNFLGAA